MSFRASSFFTDAAKEDVESLYAEDPELVREVLRLAKELESNPYLGDPLREKSTMRPLAQADCRKIKFDCPDRRSSAKPRYRYRLVHRIEPHDGSPETVVVLAAGVKPGVYRDATTEAARRLRDEVRGRARRGRA